MSGELIAYDADGNVVGTLGHMVARDTEGNVIGLIDFAAHEAAGGEHTDIWIVGGGVPAKGQATPYVPGTEWAAKGSKVWPEWLGSQAHQFRVELEGPPGAKHISALVHKTSGHRRERAAIEAAIANAPTVQGEDAKRWPGGRDLRAIVGGPNRPLQLDDQGRTAPRPANAGTPKHLPMIGAGKDKPAS